MSHGLEPRITRHEEVAIQFARRISRALSAASREGKFGSLVLAAEPHFLGLLRAALPKSLRGRVRAEIPREFARGSDQAVRKQVLRALAA